MDLVVTQDERQEKVVVERIAEQAGGYRVTVGDRVHHVDWIERSGGVWSLIIEGQQHELATRRLSSLTEGHYSISGSQSETEVRVADPLTHLARESRGGAGAGGAQVVNAPMPGRVVAVLAEAGTEVEAGQGIVVLEAMKMENEISAEQSGTLIKLLVEAGQAVEGGDPLFEVGRSEDS